MADKSYAFTWATVIARLNSEPPDTVIQVSKPDIAHPLDAEMERLDSAAQDPRPQYGRVLAGGKVGCHVTENEDCYWARLYFLPATARPESSKPARGDRNGAAVPESKSRGFSLSSLTSAAPGFTLGCVALVGAVLGAAFSAKPQRGGAAAAGAGAGLVVGLAMVAVDTAESAPKTSEVAQGLLAVLTSAALAGPAAARVIRLVPSARSTPSKDNTSKTKAKSRKASHDIPV